MKSGDIVENKASRGIKNERLRVGQEGAWAVHTG